MKSKYTFPTVEILEFCNDSKICVLSGGENEPFSEIPGGGFDF